MSHVWMSHVTHHTYDITRVISLPSDITVKSHVTLKSHVFGDVTHVFSQRDHMSQCTLKIDLTLKSDIALHILLFKVRSIFKVMSLFKSDITFKSDSTLWKVTSLWVLALFIYHLEDSFWISDMPHSYVWYDVWHDSFICVTRHHFEEWYMKSANTLQSHITFPFSLWTQ